ncbi:hypothetical protein SAMN05421783_101110 [Thiocapsa roseopersicina]|uniref:Uncharacterized protein n=2 Tax=Thiocapsa roseopersicina TaxID=1058 RepID=A0A1H2Q606_THIRO|nr:hypothetical protein SAMN05421783_101110 [Thiocapsa roseopersicina]
MIDGAGAHMETQYSAADLTERKRRRIRLARLEADIAYFQARLEMIGEPKTANQLTQRKAFVLLLKTVSTKVAKVQRERPG